MTRLLLLTTGFFLMLSVSLPRSSSAQSTQDTRFFELRIYTAHPGKRDALVGRFRRHTVRLFARHEISTIGHWIPTEDSDKLYYIVSYPDRETRDGAWQGFLDDPEWKRVYEASRQDGPLVASIESVYMDAADYTVPIVPYGNSDARFFELRIYSANEDKLSDLHARFRNHTVDIFTSHGMDNVWYWRLTDEDQGAGIKMLYILAYKDRADRDQAWNAFREDPKWIEAKEASEQNGALVSSVESVFMTPTDYSPVH